MERTFRDDLKVVLAVLAGTTLGWFVFDADASSLLGAVIGAGLVLCGLAALRLVQRRRSA